ncbi:hypothetical protein DXG01_008852, partial [Tephrocybe rancida]
MAELTPEEIITTVKRLDVLIRETFEEGYPYQRLKGFYPIHPKKINSWPSVVSSQDEKVIEARIYSPAFQMARHLQEYSRQTRDHPENEAMAWQAVLNNAALKKYIHPLPENNLIPPIASLPVLQANAGVSPAPLLASAPLIASAPLLAPAPLVPVLCVPGAIPGPLPVAASVPDIGPGNTVHAPGPSPVMIPANFAPTAGAAGKAKTAMISAAGNPVHGPSGSKPKPKGDKVNVAAEKDTAPAEDDAPGDKGKTAPGKPDKEDMVIKGVHAFPCKLCKVRGWVCQKRVGKDRKIGAYAACYAAKGVCTHSMKGKGKKIDNGATEAPKKSKPKRKAPKTPVYVSDKDDEATAPIPLPPLKRACVIIPADPIRVVSQEDVDAARRRVQN